MVDFGFRQSPSEFSTAPVRSTEPTGQLIRGKSRKILGYVMPKNN